MLSRSRLKRKKKIRPVSKKRAVELKKYAVLRDEFLSDQPWCEIGAPSCTGKATEVHHSMGRGNRLNMVEYFFSVCRSCHRWVENNKREARKKGWIGY